MDTKKEKLEISIDDREPKELFNLANFWIKNKNFNKFTIKKRHLKVCDMLCNNIGIEIKRFSTGDPKNSIIDGRFPNQVIQMKKSGLDKFIYIFIGKVDDMFDSIKKYSPNNIKNQLIKSYYGVVASLQTKYNCSINVVPNNKHAVLLAFFIFKHADLTPKDNIILKSPSNLMDEKSRKIASLCCLESVGVISAKKVLDKYDIPELKNIKEPIKIKKETGIRISSAKSIVDYFNK